MNYNLIATGIELIGTTVKTLNVENNIVDVEQSAKRSFGLNINEPQFSKSEDRHFAQMTIDFEIVIEQSEEQTCKLSLSLEGAFLSEENEDNDIFQKLVLLNGAAAMIGIARGKIESISASIFNNGKVVIPFVNVVDYYKSLSE